MAGTKLGAADPVIARRSGLVSSVFRSGVSMRSFAQLPTVQSAPQPNPNRQELTVEERNAVLSRDLKIGDPQAPKYLVRLRYTTNTFEEVLGMSEDVIVHIDQTGRIGPMSPLKLKKAKGEAVDEAGEEEEEGGKPDVLRNQFNFCDRATQGRIIVHIDQATLTEAPRPKDGTGVTNQREIADAYARDKQTSLIPSAHAPTTITRVMERIVNQNADPNACCDFRYFDDPRDAITKDSGYTLPLWEFKSDRVAHCGVSAIRWNPSVHDLFAVTYLPVLATGPQRGFLAVWTLKNQSTPKSIIELSAPAFSLDWSPNQASVIAVGTNDGNMAIFDARTSVQLFGTHKLADRHSSAVTVVRWQPPDTSGNQTLLSASLDGRILYWTLVQNEMKVSEVCRLPAGVIALDYFNESATHYRVACDDGRIYHVLRTRTTEPPTAFEAHSPPILSLCCNRFHSAVYLSSGSDWSVKVWREGETQPLQSYDYAPYCVIGCQFAPYSSTILATVTSDGSLYLYDIAVNRYEAICKTEVVEAIDGGLAALRFHPKWPVMLIGDEKGRVHALKLSPNLRRNTLTVKEEEARSKLTQSTSRDSRGPLPDLTQQADDEDDAANLAAEEEAKLEALAAVEAEKFVKAMGVSWIIYPDVAPAIPNS
jgi:dynein intermediate chain 1